MKTLLLTQVFSLAFLICFSQQPGTLDKTFGEKGIVISSNPGGTNRAFASAILEDDKILVASGYYAYPNSALLLSRYLPDGTPDTSFGENGRLFFKDYPSVFNGLTIQEDNKILLAGSTDAGSQTKLTVARFNPDGSPDSSFGVNGIYVDSITGLNKSATDVIEQPDGKIVLCGSFVYDPDDGTVYSVVARLNSDGTYDKLFADNGQAILKTSTFLPCKVALQPDGKIICAGNVDLLSFAALIRYNADGTLDKQFGNNGIVTTTFDKYGGNYYKDVCIQPDEKILATGTTRYDASNYGYPYIAVARYNKDGSLDKSFGDEGKAIPDAINYSLGTSLTLQLNGKIIIAGAVLNPEENFATIKLDNNGVVDSSFGENGETVTDIMNKSGDEAYNVALQSDGKIIVSGNTQDANLNISSALARYYGDPVKQQNPVAKKIRRWIKNHILNWQGLQDDDVSYYSIEQSSNGINGFKEIGRVKKGQRSLVNGQYSYDVSNASANSQQLTANSSTNYRIRAVSNDGSNVVSDVISDESVSSITVSPNPVKDVLKIAGLSANHTSTINIISRNGNVLQSSICNASVCNINVAQLHAGLYNAQVVSNGKTQTIKFVKE